MWLNDICQTELTPNKTFKLIWRHFLRVSFIDSIFAELVLSKYALFTPSQKVSQP